MQQPNKNKNIGINRMEQELIECLSLMHYRYKYVVGVGSSKNIWSNF